MFDKSTWSHIVVCVSLTGALAVGTNSLAQGKTTNLSSLKTEAATYIDGHAKLVQQIVDSTFSFQEVAFNEYQTQTYLTGILSQHGFKIQRNIAGIPTGWVATWSSGTGKPVISLNNDEDGLPGLSQMPGVLKKEPMIVGGPGQAEGHNTGLAGIVVAALALREVMTKHDVSGTVQVWPGVAEEIVDGKAWYVRAGVFKDVDVVLSTHVSSGLSTSYGRSGGTGLISAVYTFHGVAAHAAADPWNGKSALASAELMDDGLNYMRQFMRPQSRTQNILTQAGLQPNIVPDQAVDWYYFREVTPAWIEKNFQTANRVAEAAATMFGTTVTTQVIGSAWPAWGNKPVAEDMYKNIQRVGMPRWSDADQEYAKAVQKLDEKPQVGLSTEVGQLGIGIKDPLGGPSDDIGDVMWSVPTVRLMYPANIPGIPFHNWAAALAEATPIAHKGATADAKVLAMTALDLYLTPELVQQAKAYFHGVQPEIAEKEFGETQPVVYHSFLPADAKPDIHIHDATMKIFRPLMEKNYYEPAKYSTYLDQLGINYPCLDQGSTCGAPAPLVPRR